MKITDFIKAIEILRKYNEEEYPLGADHHEVYFYANKNNPINEEDYVALRKLGAYQLDQNPDSDIDYADYEKKDSWVFLV